MSSKLLLFGLLTCVICSTNGLVCHEDQFQFYDPYSPKKCLNCDNCIEGKGRPMHPRSEEVGKNRHGATKCAICVDCEEGTFNDKQALQCQRCDDCKPEYYIEEKCTAKSNTKCRLCSKCDPGYEVTENCSRTSDTKCSNIKSWFFTTRLPAVTEAGSEIVESDEIQDINLHVEELRDHPHEKMGSSTILTILIVVLMAVSGVLAVVLVVCLFQRPTVFRNRIIDSAAAVGQLQEDPENILREPMILQIPVAPSIPPEQSNLLHERSPENEQTSEKTSFADMQSQSEVAAHQRTPSLESRVPRDRQQTTKLESSMGADKSQTTTPERQISVNKQYVRKSESRVAADTRETTKTEPWMPGERRQTRKLESWMPGEKRQFKNPVEEQHIVFIEDEKRKTTLTPWNKKKRYLHCYDQKVDTDTSSAESDSADLETDAMALLPSIPSRRPLRRHHSYPLDNRQQMPAPDKWPGPDGKDEESRWKVQNDDRSRRPYVSEMNYLSKRLLDGCVDLGRFEGIPDHELNAIQINNPNIVEERGFKILKKWVELKGAKGTIKNLIDAIKKIGRQDIIDDFLNATFTPDEDT